MKLAGNHTSKPPTLKELAAPGDTNNLAGPPISVPASLAKCTTDAERIGVICKKYKATYERSTPTGDSVRVRLLKEDGDAVSGNGATTADAVANLISKLGDD